jgi:flavin-dependent dehydrogenase
MTDQRYDIIVVGARCAGSPTAMLLARKGYRVLVVDKASFPSDTLSTHLIHPPGVDAMKRWGVLGQVVATGCPPIDTYALDFGPFVLVGSPGTPESPVAYGPRRTVLDKILVDAAADAGADVREEFTVDEILMEDGRVTGIRGHDKGGGSVVDRARVVVGADGRHSLLAKAVAPESYHEKPPLLCGYYSYFSGMDVSRFETYARSYRGFAAWPTNDGLTLVVGGWPYREFEANKSDVEGNWMKMLDQEPKFAARVRAGKREDKFYGTPVPNYFRKPYGPGWALVGDAGYNKDYITAFGITDAFLQSEMVATALDEWFLGAKYDDVMGRYQEARDDRAIPFYEFTTQIATQDPLPPQLQQLFRAMAGNQEAMDAFARMNAEVMSPAEFFSEENVGRIMAAAGGAAGRPA